MTAVNVMAPHVLEHAGAGADGDQSADSTAIVLDIDSIIVADRFRRDIGDVTDLAKSIVEVGLLNPITVREWHGGYRLVAGERRLTAFKSLGLAEIPARIAREIVDARDALVAERDENTARKPMLPSEATALGIAIQEMEAPAARERMASGGRIGADITNGVSSRELTPSSSGHQSRDIAADAVGMSPATYTRMKTILTTAADESQPETVRDAAREAVEAIDQGGPVRASYDKVKQARTRAEKHSKPKRSNDKTDYLIALAAIHPTMRIAYEKESGAGYSSVHSFDQATRTAGVKWQFSEKQWQARAATSVDILERSSMSIDAALFAITERVDFTTITSEQATEALERLNASTLNRIIKQLKEISNV